MSKFHLSEIQLKLLEDEFGITSEQLQTLTKDEWTSIREKCFWLECNEVDDNTGDCSEKGEIAADIADVTFAKLFMK